MSYYPNTVKRVPRDAGGVELFRNFDYVQKAFVEINNRNASSDEINEIIAAVDQSIEYFRNATNAAISVKPLLFYYGILSFGRAIVLLMSNTREANLSASHGLHTKCWKAIMADGIETVLSLKVSVTKGTFHDLFLATRNESYYKFGCHEPHGYMGGYPVDIPRHMM